MSWWRHRMSTLFLLLVGMVVTATSNFVNESQMCRTVLNNREIYCSVDDFAWFTCLSCYLYLPEHSVDFRGKFFVCPGMIFTQNCTHVPLCAPKTENGTTIITRLAPESYNLSDPDSDIYATIVKESDKQRLRMCCQNAVDCCHKMLNDEPATTDSIMCPRTWDSWQCFDDTPVNQSFEAPCPEHAFFRRDVGCPLKFKRPCEYPGHWSYRPGTDLEWTNYSSCVDKDTVAHYVHLGAYCVSLLALMPALFIFFSYKQLRVPRITMHKNLFISIFINGVVFIIFKYFLIVSPLESTNSILKEGTAECKFLYVLTKYSRTSNYMWMFCEGLYLHKLIVAAFAEQKNLVIYYLIGWGFPIIPSTIYSILMSVSAESNSGCWFAPEGYEWVFHVPNVLSLALNVIFLCNIIRVLIIKLRATNTNEPSQYKKAVRATFVLVPLFGVHFVVTIHRPSAEYCEWLEVYYYVNYLLDGLQGFLVALIFCYLNGEVHVLIKRSYKRWRLRRNPCPGSLGQSTTSQIMTMSVIVMRDQNTRSETSENDVKINGNVKSKLK